MLGQPQCILLIPFSVLCDIVVISEYPYSPLQTFGWSGAFTAPLATTALAVAWDAAAHITAHPHPPAARVVARTTPPRGASAALPSLPTSAQGLRGGRRSTAPYTALRSAVATESPAALRGVDSASPAYQRRPGHSPSQAAAGGRADRDGHPAAPVGPWGSGHDAAAADAAGTPWASAYGLPHPAAMRSMFVPWGAGSDPQRGPLPGGGGGDDAVSTGGGASGWPDPYYPAHRQQQHDMAMYNLAMNLYPHYGSVHGTTPVPPPFSMFPPPVFSAAQSSNRSTVRGAPAGAAPHGVVGGVGALWAPGSPPPMVPSEALHGAAARRSTVRQAGADAGSGSGAAPSPTTEPAGTESDDAGATLDVVPSAVGGGALLDLHRSALRDSAATAGSPPQGTPGCAGSAPQADPQVGRAGHWGHGGPPPVVSVAPPLDPGAPPTHASRLAAAATAPPATSAAAPSAPPVPAYGLAPTAAVCPQGPACRLPHYPTPPPYAAYAPVYPPYPPPYGYRPQLPPHASGGGGHTNPNDPAVAAAVRALHWAARPHAAVSEGGYPTPAPSGPVSPTVSAAPTDGFGAAHGALHGASSAPPGGSDSSPHPALGGVLGGVLGALYQCSPTYADVAAHSGGDGGARAGTGDGGGDGVTLAEMIARASGVVQGAIAAATSGVTGTMGDHADARARADMPSPIGASGSFDVGGGMYGGGSMSGSGYGAFGLEPAAYYGGGMPWMPHPYQLAHRIQYEQMQMQYRLHQRHDALQMQRQQQEQQ